MKPTSLISLFATFALTFANTNNSASPESGLGPGPANDAIVFQEASKSPNATGAVDLHATNMSVDGNTGIALLWAAHLNITEVTNLNYTSSPTDVITNSVLSIDTLGNWVPNSLWETKIIIFTDVALNATVDGQKDTGDCHAALGQQCVDDYTLSIGSLFISDALNVTQVPAPPASCQSRLSSASVVNELSSTFADRSAYYYASSAAYPASNTTYYEQAATRIWPIIVMQTGKYGPNNASGISSTRMSCLRANATTEGSVAIGKVPGAAASVKVYTSAVVGIACLEPIQGSPTGSAEISQATDAENKEQRKELDEHIADCKHILRAIDNCLQKYNVLGDEKKEGQADIRLKISAYTTAISMNLKLYILGGLGRVEKQLQNQGDDLKDIPYENDDREFWRELRRQLLEESFPLPALQKKKGLIKAYVGELGSKGILDKDGSDGDEALDCSADENATHFTPPPNQSAQSLPNKTLKVNLQPITTNNHISSRTMSENENNENELKKKGGPTINRESGAGRPFFKDGPSDEVNNLFLGNYIDRGKQSIETINLLLVYKIKFPENLFLLRGNHEISRMTEVFGFYDECQKRYNSRTWMGFIDCFNYLPIAAIVGSSLFVIHGGLSPKLNVDQFQMILRPTEIPDCGPMCDWLWSDPDPNIAGWDKNDHGVALKFGPDNISRFLQKHNLDLICRSNQVVEKWYEFMTPKRELVTISSAPNSWEGDNAGAIMCVDEDMLCEFQATFKRFLGVVTPLSGFRKRKLL
ncbi:hypothetical protein G7Y89_g10294 [Cudoniella acicularis]|uniref:Serine/threonine-protein phosphatase n=1 Tax=Cudoniella acicularis TaxID=354080 RepID=A0A8H4RFD0_9HELO|nr:hypothetical protein G7Y89_g10294 [Cudoniella acicularis]